MLLPADGVDAASGRTERGQRGALVHVAVHVERAAHAAAADAAADATDAAAAPGEPGAAAQLAPLRRAWRRTQLALRTPRRAQCATTLRPATRQFNSIEYLNILSYV